MPDFIEVKHLKKYFSHPRGLLHAVDDVSFGVERGKTLGVVGESGCGKSTLGRVLAKLETATSGKVFLNGEDITSVKGRDLKRVREKVQIIFQDPYSSLNPRMTVEETIREPLLLSKKYKNSEVKARVAELMKLAGIDERLGSAFPHELDGGRRQRVGIARALALEPDFIVCDEPVSALDVSIQAQILNLLMDLQQAKNLTLMFITHDLSVVRHISDRICVMYLGQIVEISDAKELFEFPLHPYTQALLSSIPSTDIHKEQEEFMLKGEIYSPIDPKPGCRFAKRCQYVCEKCMQDQKAHELLPGHYVSCWRARELFEAKIDDKK